MENKVKRNAQYENNRNLMSKRQLHIVAAFLDTYRTCLIEKYNRENFKI